MRIVWHKHSVFFITVITVILVCGLFAAGYKIWQSRLPKEAMVSTSTAPAEPAKQLDPLQIEAIKTRDYPGSTIVVEQDFDDQGGYTKQIVSYTSDGLKVYALLMSPAGSVPNGGWPTVILNHGYIHPTEHETNGLAYQNMMAALARAKIAVIKPDFRGHGTSQGVAGGGHFSPVYAYDDLNLIASIKKTPSMQLNSKRLGTLGHSMGAHVSLRVAVTSADIKATAYLSGVVSSIADILYAWPNSPMPTNLPASIQSDREALLVKYGTPIANPEFWNSVSAINYVGNITGKSQIQHSETDIIVPKSFSDRLDAALKSAGKPVDYYVYPGNDHQLSGDSLLVYSRLVSFFTESL